MSILKTKAEQITISREQAKELLKESYAKKHALHMRIYELTEKLTKATEQLDELVGYVGDNGCPIFRKVADLYMNGLTRQEEGLFFEDVEQEAERLLIETSEVKLIKWL